jgi:hypothetical protein
VENIASLSCCSIRTERAGTIVDALASEPSLEGDHLERAVVYVRDVRPPRAHDVEPVEQKART